MTIDLRLGDCMAALGGLPSLADGAIDVVITDPPFDERTHRSALEVRGEGPRSMTGDHAAPLPFAPLNDKAVRLVAAELARVARRWIVVFAADRQVEAWASALEGAGARFVRTGIAARTNAKPQLTGDRPGTPGDWIVVAHAGTRGRMRWNGGGKAGLWWAALARHDLGGQVHPTQKPLALMRALVEDFADPGELVCDPFSGAGSTAIACAETGRRFIGWELDPEYHGSAVERLGRMTPMTVKPSHGVTATAKPSRCMFCGESLGRVRSDARYHRRCRQQAYRERLREGRVGSPDVVDGTRENVA